MFTKFSIWAEETADLIINVKKQIPNSQINQWMHKEGPCIGVRHQERWLSENADKEITLESMINSKKEAFFGY